MVILTFFLKGFPFSIEDRENYNWEDNDRDYLWYGTVLIQYNQPYDNIFITKNSPYIFQH
jgi:hypothetical protein